MNKNAKLVELPETKLYKGFFAPNAFVGNIKKQLYQTYWQGKYSKNSCAFVDYNKERNKDDIVKETVDILESVFKISNHNLFEKKFNEAISGDGQEWKRIAVLHSSSLIALLCFYSVNEDNPLSIIIDGEKCTFTESHFECKNKVGTDKSGKAHYSNMDVVLVGKTDDNKSVILFLESKFSEYLENGKYDGISNDVYGGIYSKLENTKGVLNFEKNKNEWTISAPKNNPQYCAGIKQMISHYQGITKSFLGSMCDRYDKVFLGEILFDFGDSINGDYFENYCNIYRQLATKLNEINTSEKFKVLSEILTYQEVFNGGFKLGDKVKDFYSLK